MTVQIWDPTSDGLGPISRGHRRCDAALGSRLHPVRRTLKHSAERLRDAGGLAVCGLLAVALAAVLLPWTSVEAVAAEKPWPTWTPPLVVDQFKQLCNYPDALGFWPASAIPRPVNRSDAYPFIIGKHYQGMARFDVGGVPYFAVTQNGNSYYDDQSKWGTGYIFGVKMESRTGRNGERLRSNRLQPKTETEDDSA